MLAIPKIILNALYVGNYIKRIAFIGILVLANACSNDLEEVKELTENFMSIENGEEVEILFTENAIPTIKIQAPKAIRYNAMPPDVPHTEFPAGMKLFVFDSEGKVESELNANQGKMTDNSDNLEVRGDVVINNIKGEKLETEELIWNKVDKKIRSEGFVKIFTDDEVIYGTGFEADENFTNYVIFNIKGVVKVKNGAL